MSDNKLNRREFLERAAAIGAAAVGAGAILSACDPPEDDDAADDQPDDEFSCNDEDALAGLDDEEIERRESHDYTDDSPVEGEYCYNCALYEEPEGGEDCGGCQLFAGPVHPDGWCDDWVGA